MICYTLDSIRYVLSPEDHIKHIKKAMQNLAICLDINHDGANLYMKRRNFYAVHKYRITDEHRYSMT